MSGSMESGSVEWDTPLANELSRIDWTKALLLSMARYACVQGRAFQVIWYDNRVRRHTTYAPGTSPVKLLAELDMMPRGGTKFMPPLERAIASIREAGEFELADIVFLTDGCASDPLADADGLTISGEWFRDQCDSLNVNSLAIVIGNEASPQHMFCDSLINIPDVDPERAGEVLDALV